MIQRTDDKTEASIGTLIKDLTDDTRTLLRQEIELAKTELSEKAARFGRNITYLAIGGVIGYAGLLTLIAAISLGLADLFNPALGALTALWVGALIAGVVISAASFVLIQKAISTLKSASLAPTKTIDSLRENAEWLKDQMTEPESRVTPGAPVR